MLLTAMMQATDERYFLLKRFWIRPRTCQSSNSDFALLNPELGNLDPEF
jgi:hypothetical protein